MIIKFKVIEVNDEKAILSNEDGQQIGWPVSLLDQKPKVGDSIDFNIGGAPAASAKDILNELLDTSD